MAANEGVKLHRFILTMCQRHKHLITLKVTILYVRITILQIRVFIAAINKTHDMQHTIVIDGDKSQPWILSINEENRGIIIH